MLKKSLLVSAFGLFPWIAGAAQTIDVRDGDAVIVKMSQREQTRIKVDGGRVLDVVGDIYDSQRNGTGDLVVEKDAAAGEVFVSTRSKSNKAASVFLKSDRGTYSLVLQPVDVPNDTVILRDRSTRSTNDRDSQASAAGNAGSWVRAAKGMIATMASRSEKLPSDIDARDVNREVALWKESRFVLERQFSGRWSIGERYRLTNVSPLPMTLAESEFFKDGVIAVAIERHALKPGQTTSVFIVKGRGDHE